MYFLERKSESFDKFKLFKAKVEKHSGKYTVNLRNDSGEGGGNKMR